MTSSTFHANFFMNIKMCQECCWNPCPQMEESAYCSPGESLDQQPWWWGVFNLVPQKRFLTTAVPCLDKMSSAALETQLFPRYF